MQDNQKPDNYYTSEKDNDPYFSTSIEPGYDKEDSGRSSVSWEASEFIYHEKKFSWFLSLTMVTALLSVAGFFILGRDVFTLVIIIILGIIFGYAGSRKPRIMAYTVDDIGIMIGQKEYKYEEFKSFSMTNGEVISSLVFTPNKRLGISIALYVPEENLNQVLEIVSSYLPLEQHEYTYSDKFLKKIKF